MCANHPSEEFEASDVRGSFPKQLSVMPRRWRPEINAVIRAIELFESLAPREGAEGMLAIQMVGTHFAALECLRRAMIPDQPAPTREHNLRMAEKFMILYGKQLETLNKHRGKGQQNVTVEYVNVEPGAQAIVGNVEASQKAPAKTAKRKSNGALADMSSANVNKSYSDRRLTRNLPDEK